VKRFVALGCVAAILCVAAAGARQFKAHSKSRALDFEYSWPSEVSAVPALVRRFTRDMREERKRMLADARDAASRHDSLVSPPPSYSFYRDVTAFGQSNRLLSLKIATYEFTGGAHGNTDSKAVLWERRQRREIVFGTLLADQGALARLLRSPFCHRLSDEQSKRNGWKVKAFEQCPKLSHLTILPGDTNRNGNFDAIHLIADQGVAGSRAEGEYDISAPITASFIAAVKPEYRSSFEVQRQ
jgi:peptidoglycan-N-acetylmuramic acid deacetylase PdaC-like protein